MYMQVNLCRLKLDNKERGVFVSTSNQKSIYHSSILKIQFASIDYVIHDLTHE
jgi:hypothetical protein